MQEATPIVRANREVVLYTARVARALLISSHFASRFLCNIAFRLSRFRLLSTQNQPTVPFSL